MTWPAWRAVLFASAFRHESALNISHAKRDDARTYCGRTGWVTDEGFETRDTPPDCQTCARALERIAAAESSE